MKITVEVNDKTFDNIVKEAVRKKLSEMGLIRFIREEITSVFHNWQRNHSTHEERFRRIDGEIGSLKREIKKRK